MWGWAELRWGPSAEEVHAQSDTVDVLSLEVNDQLHLGKRGEEQLHEMRGIRSCLQNKTLPPPGKLWAAVWMNVKQYEDLKILLSDLLL